MRSVLAFGLAAVVLVLCLAVWAWRTEALATRAALAATCPTPANPGTAVLAVREHDGELTCKAFELVRPARKKRKVTG